MAFSAKGLCRPLSFPPPPTPCRHPKSASDAHLCSLPSKSFEKHCTWQSSRRGIRSSTSDVGTAGSSLRESSAQRFEEVRFFPVCVSPSLTIPCREPLPMLSCSEDGGALLLHSLATWDGGVGGAGAHHAALHVLNAASSSTLTPLNTLTWYHFAAQLESTRTPYA